MTKSLLYGAGVLAVGAILAQPAAAMDMAEHYKGKTITILYGYGAGGTYGKTSLLLSRHLGRHIPGNPTVITQSMPGAGGLKSANYAANVMPRDGHNLLMPPDMSMVSQALRPENVKYDARKFIWLGRVFGSNNVLAVRRDTGVVSIDQAMKTEVIMGSTGKGSPTFIVTALVNGLLGTKFKIVTGYKGSAVTKQSMEQGETQGISLAWASWKNDKADWFKGKDSFAAALVQSGFERDRDWPDLPLVSELTRDPDRKAAALLIATSSLIGRGLALPPGAPEELVGPLREAFWATVHSAGFTADAEKTKLPLLQKKGEEIQKTVHEILGMSPAAIEIARKSIFGGES
ncbi:MAG: hypothetical protein GEU92_14865 [Alphaproteobacteria bacterium]|nr:hypothetical protein [Alphaproteobacteria bacterium]